MTCTTRALKLAGHPSGCPAYYYGERVLYPLTSSPFRHARSTKYFRDQNCFHWYLPDKMHFKVSRGPMMHINEIIQPSVGADLSRPSPIMNINDQSRSCHAERSEASRCPSRQILRGVYPERSEWLRMTSLYRSWLLKIIIGLRWLSRYPDEKVNLHYRAQSHVNYVITH